MGKFQDLTGQKFGRLTVIKRVDDYVRSNGIHIHRWLCKCDCGKECIVKGVYLRCGDTKSCGCLEKEIKSITHSKKNKYDLTGNYGVGWDDDGNEFWFDLEDYGLISKYCWHKDDKDGFVTNDKDNKGKKIYLHRLIMGVDKDDWKIQIDHIGHNRYDNRKSKLRICSISNNGMNKRKPSNNTSGVVGVYWIKDKNKWRSQIVLNQRTIYLGYFENFDDAVNARKKAEEKYFGKWSYDNSMKLSEGVVYE